MKTEHQPTTNLEPFVDTLGVEFVTAGKYTQQLAVLKVTHAHHTARLVQRRLAHFGIVAVGGQHVDVPFRETLWSRISKTLGKI